MLKHVQKHLQKRTQSVLLTQHLISFAFKIVVLRIDFYPRFPGKKSSVKKAWKI